MVFNDSEYISLFKNILNNVSDDEYEDESPKDIITLWSDFVDDLYKGYDYSAPEFDNDLDIIREPIELLINEPKLTKFDEHRIFCHEINKIDKKYKEITVILPSSLSKDKYWWRNVVLKYSKNEYAEFINSHYKDSDIKVKVID